MSAEDEAAAARSAAYIQGELDNLDLDPDGDKALALRASLRALTKRRRATDSAPYARPASSDQQS